MLKCCTKKHVNNFILQVIENNVICILYICLAAASLNNVYVFHSEVWSSVVFENKCEHPQHMFLYIHTLGLSQVNIDCLHTESYISLTECIYFMSTVKNIWLPVFHSLVVFQSCLCRVAVSVKWNIRVHYLI